MKINRDMVLSEAATNIADAAIRVMVQQGLDALSVRHVAAEAKVAPGTVQYHMGSRDDIIAIAFIRSIQRQLHRATREFQEPSVYESLVIRLSELLPIGPVQREDAAVWVIIGAAASTREWLATIHNQQLAYFRALIESALETADAQGFLRPEVTVPQAARLVTALVDGLTLDSLNAPDVTAERVIADLRIGLSLLFRE
ncbi:MAG: TetR family transcriptional regulator C-terminal domain-containing protein [Corynebacterium sp.]|nr:TetR family transcriptional regulator C-terminal domain-containing protein [Corynebacterium sp.]